MGAQRDAREYRARLERAAGRWMIDELLIPIELVAYPIERQLASFGSLAIIVH